MPVTVRIEFTARPIHKRFWWFLDAGGRCQLGVSDPDGVTDLCLAAAVADLIRVFRDDLTIGAALDCGRLEALGRKADRLAFGGWLNLSPLARVRPARASWPALPALPASARRRAPPCSPCRLM